MNGDWISVVTVGRCYFNVFLPEDPQNTVDWLGIRELCMKSTPLAGPPTTDLSV